MLLIHEILRPKNSILVVAHFSFNRLNSIAETIAINCIQYTLCGWRYSYLNWSLFSRIFPTIYRPLLLWLDATFCSQLSALDATIVFFWSLRMPQMRYEQSGVRNSLKSMFPNPSWVIRMIDEWSIPLISHLELIIQKCNKYHPVSGSMLSLRSHCWSFQPFFRQLLIFLLYPSRQFIFVAS